MAVDIKYLEKAIEQVSEAANGLRHATAANFADDVADALDAVHSAMEEIVSAIEDLSLAQAGDP